MLNDTDWPTSVEETLADGVVTVGSVLTVKESVLLETEVTPAESVTVTKIEYVPVVDRSEQVTEAVEPEQPLGSPVQV